MFRAMKPGQRALSLFTILLGAAGAAVCLEIRRQAASWTIVDHRVRIEALPLILTFVVGAALLYAFWRAYSAARGSDVSLALLPLLALWVAPLAARDYLIRDDLRYRLTLLAVFVVASVAYLAISARPRPSGRASLGRRAFDAFNALPVKKRAIALFLAALIAYAACVGILVSRGVTFSGDEPNYLLTAHSLVHDRDINLANNYANKDYFHFYNREDNPRLTLGIYGQYGRKGESYIYPINLPGISVLMVPFYALSGLLKGAALTAVLKGSLALWAALFGVQIYLLALERWRREGLALGMWAIVGFTTPVLFYAVHLYPEIPVALVSVFVYRKLTSAAAPSAAKLVLCGLLLGTLPWFGLKYLFILGPLLLVGAFELIKRHRLRARVLWFAAPPLLSIGLFYAFVYSLYGTLSPLAVYEGIQTPERSRALLRFVFGYPLHYRVESFLDYFLDQRDGLFLYAPAYAFALLGLGELVRRKSREAWQLALIALPFLLNYAFFTHRQGYCPQARVVTPLIWIGAIGLGEFLAARRRPGYRGAFGIAAAAGLAIVAVLMAHPSYLYQPTTHEYTDRAGELFVHLSNIKVLLPPVLPSFLKIENAGYWPNYIWTAGLVLFAAAYFAPAGWLRKLTARRGLRGETPARPTEYAPSPVKASRAEASARVRAAGVRLAITLILLLAAAGLWVLPPRPVPYASRKFTYSSGKTLGFYLSPMGEDVVAKNEAEFYLHRERSYRLLFASAKPIENLKLVFGSKEGTHDVRASLFDQPIFEGRTDHEKNEIVIAPAASYRWRGFHLYLLDFGFRKLSKENLLIDPYMFQVVPLR